MSGIFFRPNTIYCGNCQDVLMKFPEGCVDLIYMDPPFFSNRHYEVIWGDGYELKAFEDRWKGGINNYISWMEPKIRACHHVLKDTGSMYLHCDWHANAYLRLLMDRVFGKNNFKNEIIWWYHDPSGTTTRRFMRKHDTIFFYGKGETTLFNADEVRTPYRPGTLEQGERGAISFGRPTKTHPKGRIREDVWEIPIVNSMAAERVGWPTQKPEALLDIIVRASSTPLSIVLDPMCGCGTAIVVAQKLARHWIGIDVSPTACKVMMRRMNWLGVNISQKDILGFPRSVDELKKMQWFDFQNWVFEKVYAKPSRVKTGDKGIDGWTLEKDSRPVQVKQSENVGRNIVDNFETAIRREHKRVGLLVAFSFTKSANEEVGRAQIEDGLKIELRTVKELVGVEKTPPIPDSFKRRWFGREP